jgi:hypothetical protein
MVRLTLMTSGLFLALSANAHAYLGPGLGVGTIVTVLGIILSLFLGIASVLYYPIKRFLKKKKNRDGGGGDGKP